MALTYLRFALGLCRMTGVQPSLLLHPLDFLGCDDIKGLAFFPAMNLPSEKKLAVVSELIRLASDHFSLKTLQQHAYEVSRKADLLQVEATIYANVTR
jgi:hypothetical protein